MDIGGGEQAACENAQVTVEVSGYDAVFGFSATVPEAVGGCFGVGLGEDVLLPAVVPGLDGGDFKRCEVSDEALEVVLVVIVGRERCRGELLRDYFKVLWAE